MQGFTATTSRGSLTFLSPRNHSPVTKKFVNPKVDFSNSHSSAKFRFSSSLVSQRCPREIVPVSATASMDFAAAASTNLRLANGLPPLAPSLKRRRRPLDPARAFKDEFFKIKLPKIAERPEWWWRTLACIPYLISLQISDVGFYVQPFLQKHKAIGDMIYFIPGAINRWPSWFFMAYCYLGYMWVVKNKDLPHYLRSHMMMGMLIETALQIIWCTSNFFPLIHFKGKFGMYYWMVIGFSYICLLLECIRCALAGIYARIPFVTDAASIHTLFNLGGFQRPIRYFTVTGQKADEETIEKLISSGESEHFLQKAIQEQGRGQIMDTLSEIQERQESVKEIERSLLELHQLFLDMAALVEAQGNMLNDIESSVLKGSSFITRASNELYVARVYQKSTRKWYYIGIIVLIVIVFVILFPVIFKTVVNKP